jgi:histidinol-phosphate phosphatase family protein
MKQAVILAGGKGTRLAKALGRDIPKPMAPVLGIPLLERLIRLLREQEITDILLLIHYRAGVIRHYFGDGSAHAVQIRYLEETEPRGTGGALRDALPLLDATFLVLYGDTLVDMDFSKLLSFHTSREADLTLFAHPNDHPQDSDLIQRDSDGRVSAVHPYPHPPGVEYRNLVNAALYVMDRNLLTDPALPEGSFDIAKHAIPTWIASSRAVFAYRGDGYIKDMGTPERLLKVEHDQASGMVHRKSGREPRPAVFIDRDGTINVEKGHLSRAGDFELLPGVAKAIRRLNQRGILAIVITNQPVIARGEASFADVERIHARMETLLAADRAFVDAVILCPHHPDKGFEGERSELKIACGCRKPATGMIDQACSIFSIDRERSWFIGDTTMDIECARQAGVRSVLVKTGNAGRDGRFDAIPTKIHPDLASAVGDILSEYETSIQPG